MQITSTRTSLRLLSFACLIGLITIQAGCATKISPPPTTASITWSEANHKKDREWFKTSEGRSVVDNILFYQHDCGGWDKNIDMAAPLTDARRDEVAQKRANPATIDNGATYTQLAFLVRAYDATGDERIKTAFLRGVDFLLDAQYENGGWPMFYPLIHGYYTHIDFNDNAIVGTLFFLQHIARQDNIYRFVDQPRVKRCQTAITKAIDCILKCQVKVNGKLTVWCAQHDEKTFAPAPARKFEPASLSGMESIGIVEFLMSQENPSPEIRESIESAVAWFEASRIKGLRLVEFYNDQGRDRKVVPDKNAPDLWARFYEIETNRPIFIGRDSVFHYQLDEIEQERRGGYAYYGPWAEGMLTQSYPKWKARWGHS